MTPRPRTNKKKAANTIMTVTKTIKRERERKEVDSLLIGETCINILYTVYAGAFTTMQYETVRVNLFTAITHGMKYHAKPSEQMTVKYRYRRTSQSHCPCVTLGKFSGPT